MARNRLRENEDELRQKRGMAMQGVDPRDMAGRIVHKPQAPNNAGVLQVRDRLGVNSQALEIQTQRAQREQDRNSNQGRQSFVNPATGAVVTRSNAQPIDYVNTNTIAERVDAFRALHLNAAQNFPNNDVLVEPAASFFGLNDASDDINSLRGILSREPGGRAMINDVDAKFKEWRNEFAQTMAERSTSPFDSMDDFVEAAQIEENFDPTIRGMVKDFLLENMPEHLKREAEEERAFERAREQADAEAADLNAKTAETLGISEEELRNSPFHDYMIRGEGNTVVPMNKTAQIAQYQENERVRVENEKEQAAAEAEAQRILTENNENQAMIDRGTHEALEFEDASGNKVIKAVPKTKTPEEADAELVAANERDEQRRFETLSESLQQGENVYAEFKNGTKVFHAMTEEQKKKRSGAGGDLANVRLVKQEQPQREDRFVKSLPDLDLEKLKSLRNSLAGKTDEKSRNRLKAIREQIKKLDEKQSK